MKVALVHEGLTQRGKAEQGFELLADSLSDRERNFRLFLSRLLRDQQVNVIIEALSWLVASASRRMEQNETNWSRSVGNRQVLRLGETGLGQAEQGF